MLSVRHHPELCTPKLWLRLHSPEWCGFEIHYGPAGQACRWLVEGGCLPPQLADIAEAICPGVAFEGVILQCYRDGRATTDCHSDQGATGLCLILSLGATRTFRVHRIPPGQRPQAQCTNPNLDAVEIECSSGTAIIMDEAFQESWHHQVAPDPGVTDERLSLVFRTRPEKR